MPGVQWLIKTWFSIKFHFHLHTWVTYAPIRVGVKYFRKYLSQVQLLLKFASSSTSTHSTWMASSTSSTFSVQVQVQVPSTLVTNNSTVSLWVQSSFTTITLVHTFTYKVKNTFQICTKITFILWNQPWIDKLCICHPTQLMDHVINHRRKGPHVLKVRHTCCMRGQSHER